MERSAARKNKYAHHNNNNGIVKRRKREPVALLLAAAESRVHPPASGRKGLRHFAIRVSKKVQEKSSAPSTSTTYVEIADELISEEKRAVNGEVNGNVDEKNIRRRVYDSLNVLIALGAIRRDNSDTGDKKAIRWIGLQSEESARVREDIERSREGVRKKKVRLHYLEEQVRALNRLITRNRNRNVNASGDTESERSERGNIIGNHDNSNDNSRLKMPFLVLSTHRNTSVNINAQDAGNRNVHFTLNRDFTIIDDRELLRRLKLHPSVNANANGNINGTITNMNNVLRDQRTTPTFPSATGLMSAPATPPSTRRHMRSNNLYNSSIINGSGGSSRFLPLSVLFSPSKSLSLSSTPRRSSALNFLATPPRFPSMVMDTGINELGFSSPSSSTQRRILPLPPPPPPSDDDYSASSQYHYRDAPNQFRNNSHNLPLKRVLVPNINHNNNSSNRNTPTAQRYRGGNGSLLGLSRI